MRIGGWAIGAFIAAAFLLHGPAWADVVNISILQTGDTLGHLTSFYYESSKPVGGVAKRAIFFQSKRQHKKMIWLTLDAGNAISGTALSEVNEGYLDIAAMNKLKYDAMVLGVHEFDYGIDVLKQRMAEAQFPILCANVTYADSGKPFAQPYVIIEREGAKIAIIGLTTGDLDKRVAPENFTGLKVADPIDTARQLVPQLKGKADIIIALTHLGVNQDILLAGQVQALDVIVGGMSRAELQSPFKVKRVMIVHAADYGRVVGLLKLSFERGPEGSFERRWWDSQLVPMDSKIVDNTDYVKWLDGFVAQLPEKMSILVGSSEVPMSDYRVRSAETILGNYICDILRKRTGADVAMLPAVFFQSSLPDGPVTLGNLYAVMPFSDHAVVLTLNGGDLKAVLDDAANQIGRPGFPQVSGVSFSIYNGQAEGVRVNGEPLDTFKTYTVATNDTAAEGTLGYAHLGTVADRRYTGRAIRDLVRTEMATGEVARAALSDRIGFLAQDPSLLAAQPPEPSPEPEPTATETAPVTEETTTEPPGAAVEEPAPEEPAPAETTPSEEAQPEVSVETPPPDEPETSGEQPAAAPEEPAAGETQPTDSMDRNDHSRQQTIQDEVVTDTGSDVEVTEQPPAGETAENTPAEAEQAPPEGESAAPPATTVADQAIELGQAKVTNGTLDYVFTLLQSPQGYEFQLQVTNNGADEVELNYLTDERFDFLVFSGNDLLWNYNYNRGFLQSEQTETLASGESLNYSAKWDGKDRKSELLGGGLYRFEALHQLLSGAVRLTLEAQIGQ